ncbi:catalytic activity protein [[Candida] boidinii]|nr:catalytic activity protein [[Candida] boidinii]
MTETKVVLIGLSGASSSGKTTTGKVLSQVLPNSILIHEDDYYLPDDQIPFSKELNDYNWDSPGAIDFPKMIKSLNDMKNDKSDNNDDDDATIQDNKNHDIKNLSSDQFELINKNITERLNANSSKYKYKFIILDGFLLYHNEKILNDLKIDVKFFFKTDYETLRSRRLNRSYNTDQGVWIDPPNYFEKFVWPEYYNNHKYLFSDNLESIKKNGGDLNDFAIKNLKIIGIQNNNNTDFNSMFTKIIDYILLTLD